MPGRIQRVLVADIAGRTAPALQSGSDGFAAELKRLAHVSYDWLDNAVDADDHGRRIVRRLTDTDIQAIRGFTEYRHLPINHHLGEHLRPHIREEFEQLTATEVRAEIRKLERALSKFPVYRGRVVRSVAMNDFRHLSGIMRRYRKGSIVTEPTFLSAAREINWKNIDFSDNRIRTSNVHFRWYSRTGKDISEYSENPYELEILTAPNTRFEVEEIAAISNRDMHAIPGNDRAGRAVAPPRPSAVSVWIALREL